ncbi:hypothetical protein D3C73_1320600 [compost metagenome]
MNAEYIPLSTNSIRRSPSDPTIPMYRLAPIRAFLVTLMSVSALILPPLIVAPLIVPALMTDEYIVLFSIVPVSVIDRATTLPAMSTRNGALLKSA